MKIKNFLHVFQQEKSKQDFQPTTDWMEPESLENILMEVKPLSQEMMPGAYKD